jgi:hypothetical protein
LNLSKTLALKGFAMNAIAPKPTRAKIPDEVKGLVVLDLCARYAKTKRKSTRTCNLFVTYDTEAINPDCSFWIFVVDEAKGSSGFRQTVGRYRLGEISESHVDIKVQNIMNERIRNGYKIEYFEQYHYLPQPEQPATLTEAAERAAGAARIYVPNPFLESGSTVIPTPEWFPIIVDAPMPAQFFIDYKPTQTTSRPVSQPRLSKADWLRQHYPEMTELPKWRFPGMAG